MSEEANKTTRSASGQRLTKSASSAESLNSEIMAAEQANNRFYGRFQDKARALKDIISKMSDEQFKAFVDKCTPSSNKLDYKALRSLPIVQLVIFLEISNKSYIDADALFERLQKIENPYLVYQEFLQNQERKINRRR